jgi:hypothetical protein
MTSFISRAAALTERVFPEIRESLYAARAPDPALSPAQSAAVSLLLTEPNNLTKPQRYLGFDLKGTGRIARTVLFHREAFLAEQAAQFRRADYFWEEFYAQFTSARARDKFWEQLASYFSSQGVEELADPANARARFLEELVIDTHVAIFNGHVSMSEELDPNSRAWIHLNHIVKALELSDLSGDERLRLVAPAFEARIDALAATNQWREVAWEITEVLRFELQAEGDKEGIPDALRARLAFFKRQRRRKKASVATELQATIGVITEVWQHFRSTPGLLHRLAMLHNHLAQALAERGEICTALVVAEKALTFNPNFAAATLTRRKLESTMIALQDKARDPEIKSSTQLGTDGPFLLDEARIGFRLVEEYKQSPEAEQLSMVRDIVRARVMWRQIGSSELDRDQVETALYLVAAVDALIAEPPASEADFLRRWSQAIVSYEPLKEVDSTAVYRFLMAELSAQSQPAADSSNYVPQITPPSPQPIQLREPFDYWVFSPRDRHLKARAIIVAIFLVTVAVLVINDAHSRSVRRDSYYRLIQASNNHNYKDVIENAEAFLSHSLLVSDNRDGEVLDQYNQALVRWVARQPNVSQPEVAARIQRYRELVRK